MNDFTFLLVGSIVGFVFGVVITVKSFDTDNALKLSNVMNASMLDCVTKQIITKEQVHDIKTIFFKHIEANFEYMKANHGDSYKENK